jgi:hypothetical protein
VIEEQWLPPYPVCGIFDGARMEAFSLNGVGIPGLGDLKPATNASRQAMIERQERAKGRPRKA